MSHCHLGIAEVGLARALGARDAGSNPVTQTEDKCCREYIHHLPAGFVVLFAELV